MSSYYSPKEFVSSIGAESTVGTAATGSALKAIESDSLGTITYGDIKTTEKRGNSGTGRLLNSSDIQSHDEGAVHEFSASGILTTDLANILFPAALGVAKTTGGVKTITIPTAFNPDAYAHGAGSSGAHQSITCGIHGATSLNANNDLFLSGCVVDSLTVSADANEMGGRFNFDMTAKSRTAASTTFSNQVPSDFTDNYLYLSDCNEISKLDNNDTIFDSFSLTIENPVSFQGNKAAGGDKGLPEKYLRAVPALKITGNVVVKYDGNTDGLIAKSKALTEIGGNSSSLIALSSDETGKGNVAFDQTTSAGFGFNLPNGIITEVTRDESDYMRLNIAFELVDRGNGTSGFFQMLLNS